MEKAIKKEQESDPDEESQEEIRKTVVSVTVKAEHDVRAELKIIYGTVFTRRPSLGLIHTVSCQASVLEPIVRTRRQD